MPKHPAVHLLEAGIKLLAGEKPPLALAREIVQRALIVIDGGDADDRQQPFPFMAPSAPDPATTARRCVTCDTLLGADVFWPGAGGPLCEPCYLGFTSWRAIDAQEARTATTATPEEKPKAEEHAGGNPEGTATTTEVEIECEACKGTGKVTTNCTLCGDSTYDHYCNDKVVDCYTCNGAGRRKVNPLPPVAKPEPTEDVPSVNAEQVQKDPLCDGCGLHVNPAEAHTCDPIAAAAWARWQKEKSEKEGNPDPVAELRRAEEADKAAVAHLPPEAVKKFKDDYVWCARKEKTSVGASPEIFGGQCPLCGDKMTQKLLVAHDCALVRVIKRELAAKVPSARKGAGKNGKPKKEPETETLEETAERREAGGAE